MKINTNNGLIARGYDLVEFFNSCAVTGDKDISLKFWGQFVSFYSISNKNLFEIDPTKYMPQYGGYCAIAMSEGKLLDPNPKSFLVSDGKLYLFTRMFFGIIDAKRQWMKNPIEKRKMADAEWEKVK